jgi:hypothetical protein
MLDFVIHFLYTDIGKFKREQIMKRWTILFFAIFTVACLLPVTITEVPVVEEPIEYTFTAPSATPDCRHASAVTLEIVRISNSTVELQVSGLQPGEKPSVLYSTSSNTSSSIGEMGDFAKGADENGEISIYLPGLIPLDEQINSTWDIRVIHTRGVECATITLP